MECSLNQCGINATVIQKAKPMYMDRITVQTRRVVITDLKSIPIIQWNTLAR